MNAKRRGALVQAIGLLMQARKLVSDVADYERDDFGRSSEKYQYSSRGEKQEEDIFGLEEVVEALKQDIEQLQDIIGD